MARGPYHYDTANAPAGFWSWQLYRTSTGERVAHGLCCLTRGEAQGEARRTKSFFAKADAAEDAPPSHDTGAGE
jgi:hypothetical protein